MLHDDDARATNERTSSSSRPSLERKQCSTSSSRNPCVVLVRRRRRRLSPSSRSHAHAPVVRAPVVHAGPRVRGSTRHVGRAFAVQDAPTPNLLWFTYSTRVDRHLHRYVYRFFDIRSVYSVYNVCKKGKKGSLRNRDFLSISSQDFFLLIPCLKKYQQRCP